MHYNGPWNWGSHNCRLLPEYTNGFHWKTTTAIPSKSFMVSVEISYETISVRFQGRRLPVSPNPMFRSLFSKESGASDVFTILPL